MANILFNEVCNILEGQIGANMLHLARVAMHNSRRARKINISDANAELDKAKDFLGNSARIARRNLFMSTKVKHKMQTSGASGEDRKDGRAALVILLQSFDALGHLEVSKQELQESNQPVVEAEKALQQCISAYKEFGLGSSLSDSPEVKAEYLLCLKHLLSLLSDNITGRTRESGQPTLQELKDEIKTVEAEISLRRKHKS